MDLYTLHKYQSIKIRTEDDRDFVIEKPYYDKMQNHISGWHIYEVTKNKSDAPFSTKFSIEDIKKIEYLCTKERSARDERWVTKGIIIIFVITFLIAYVKECT